MAGGRRIVIEFLGKDTSAGSTASAVEKKFGALGGKLERVGTASGRLLAGGLLAGGAAMVKFGDQASDLAETQSKVTQIFGEDSVDALDKFAAGAAKSMGQSKQTALDAAATFGMFGKMAKLSGEDLVGFSTDMTGLASDMASFSNTSPEEAIEAIGSALRGEAEPIRKYGVLLDDATLRNEALKMGLIRTTKEALTPQQKVLAAQSAIMAQTSDQQGDFARTSDGLANKQRILKAELENMSTTLGTKALPFMLKAVDAGTKFSEWAGKNKGLVIGLGVAIGGTALTLKTISLYLKLSAMYTKLYTLATTEGTVAQKALNLAMRMNPIGLVITAIALLVAGMIIAYKKSETFRKIVDGAFRGIANAAKFLWDGVLKPVFKLWLNMWFTVVGAMLSGAAKAFGWVPGIGGKLKAAAEEFERFRDKVNRALDGIHSQKEIRLKVTTQQIVANPSLAKPRVEHRASGGPVLARRAYLVGEVGPELFVPGASGAIVPNGSGGSTARTVGGNVATSAPIILQLDSRTVWKGLLKIKRDGGIELGLA